MFGMKKIVPGVGSMIKGWDISDEHFRDPEKLPVVDLAVMTNSCPHRCDFCFTERRKISLSLGEIKNLIDQLAEKQTYAIDFLGEGEPTLDENFFEIIEHTSKKGIIPLVYTEASLKLRDYDFASRLFDAGASVLPKCDSLFNRDYQNSVVQDRSGRYFDLRNQAIENLMKLGFNKVEPDGTTRLGFDMVLSEENIGEVEKTLRYCRENNLYIMFAFHLTSGLDRKNANNIVKERLQIARLVEKIDKEYDLERTALYNNFLTGPCKEYLMIRGSGDVQVCPGNELVVGNIKEKTLEEILENIKILFPHHNRETYTGNCPYRPNLS